MPTLKPTILPLLFGWFSLLCLSGCKQVSGDFLADTSPIAKDWIMYVRETPPTFGFLRLRALLERYPDLSAFIAEKGSPDFLAETEKGDNYIAVLYYLEKRQAYACRCGAGLSREVEFSGPYPITDGEAKTLGALRNGIPVTKP